jgi:DMSO/TMAO reductase YedYZ molybdopterin-dependent catalytic subunit
VDQRREVSFGQQRALPSRTVTAMMECAGNSRIFLSPKVTGLQWEQGAVGNAAWTGVPLAEVLRRAGVKPGALEVVLEGADSGEIKKEPVSPGKITYARSLQMDKAMSEEVILAYAMNGEELTPSHGFPLRAVVPGHYGMASVKWLKSLLVIDREFRGYFQTTDYTSWERKNGLPIQLLPVTEVEVKAQISRPALYEAVPANSVYRVFGAAWTGEAEVAKVEVSADGGTTWMAAQLLSNSEKYAWRLWEYHWRVPAECGRCTLMARATDTLGRVQPMVRDAHRGTYVITHVQPIEVEIKRLKGDAADGENYAI